MKTTSTDQHGNQWSVAWGLVDERQALADEFDIKGTLTGRGEAVIFTDPRYSDETKTLHVYKAVENNKHSLVAIAEITPGIYAVGVRQ
ncbi:hypothetical protein [Aliiroseovarius subalbicans]|uniref:hypothetical protein n=1 Tax=Aliiroseovarius subalbicans TaxID=2925840 RepID=UPI001F56C70F|nr:hypothetical protein [Aliiroseovarius subalbicans]MCI2399515.1 hypothetical protein [Aliiroseovarius subalbicans]